MNTRPYYDLYSDWDSWVQEGIVDLAVPMTFYNWDLALTDYTKWMNFGKDRKSNRHMIVGVGTSLNSLANAILELQMTRNPSPAGNYADGFCGATYAMPFFNGTWPEFSPVLVSQVTPTWDDIPDLPWKSSPTKGDLMGTVTLGDTGTWADHATVAITGPVSRSMYVDGTGFYAFIDLPPGSYTVTATKAGYPNAQATVNVAVGVVTGNMYEQNLMLGAPPQLSIARNDPDGVIISWPAPVPGWVLEQNSTLATNTWSSAGITPAQTNGWMQVTISPEAESRHYRLRQQPWLHQPRTQTTVGIAQF